MRVFGVGVGSQWVGDGHVVVHWFVRHVGETGVNARVCDLGPSSSVSAANLSA